jgi:hypothetical protein
LSADVAAAKRLAENGLIEVTLEIQGKAKVSIPEAVHVHAITGKGNFVDFHVASAAVLSQAAVSRIWRAFGL